jgi:putative transposase
LAKSPLSPLLQRGNPKAPFRKGGRAQRGGILQRRSRAEDIRQQYLYIKVKGRWAYLYRAIDRDGNLVDVLLSEKCDKAAAEVFFRSARTVTGSVPARVTTDGHDAYPGAIKAEPGEEVSHRINRYLNNHLEQDHRGIKQRTQPMGEFKSVESARRFCRVYDEVRNFLRPRSCRNEMVLLTHRRLLYTARTRVLLTSLAAA